MNNILSFFVRKFDFKIGHEDRLIYEVSLTITSFTPANRLLTSYWHLNCAESVQWEIGNSHSHARS